MAWTRISPRNAAAAAQFRLQHLAFELGLSGHLDYGRFIILGRGRTGSNFLRGLLNSHSRIIAFGELFRSPDAIGWERPGYDRFQHSPPLVALMRNEPVRFLQKKVFRRFPRRIGAVGFKLFYYHAQDSAGSVWTYLQQQKDVKVIHLKRKNTLRMILSEKKAFKTNHWTNTTGAAEAKFSVAIDYDECARRFVLEQAVAQQYDDFFRNHPKLELVYEDLASDYRNHVKPILDFLELDYQALRPSTYKQSNQPLPEAIENYAELEQRFRGTPWAGFFEADDRPPTKNHAIESATGDVRRGA
jgi:LPS sulfotransferase NodH